jgi:hypothetical protein
MNKQLIDKLVAIAKAEVGTREEGGNNRGKRVREYQSATWLEPGAWAWCAALCAWVLRQWLKDPDVLDALKIRSPEWGCKDASAFGWEKWAKGKGLQVLPETEKAKAGDFVIFDFSHIGIVIEDQTGDTIKTVEGNTNGKGERDSASGDGVWLKTRAQSLTKCYIRLMA